MVDDDPLFFHPDHRFPNADRGEELLICRVGQKSLLDDASQFMRLAQTPGQISVPNRSCIYLFSSGSLDATQSEISLIGPTIPPRISIDPTPCRNESNHGRTMCLTMVNHGEHPRVGFSCSKIEFACSTVRRRRRSRRLVCRPAAFWDRLSKDPTASRTDSGPAAQFRSGRSSVCGGP